MNLEHKRVCSPDITSKLLKLCRWESLRVLSIVTEKTIRNLNINYKPKIAPTCLNAMKIYDNKRKWIAESRALHDLITTNFLKKKIQLDKVEAFAKDFLDFLNSKTIENLRLKILNVFNFLCSPSTTKLLSVLGFWIRKLTFDEFFKFKGMKTRYLSTFERRDIHHGFHLLGFRN